MVENIQKKKAVWKEALWGLLFLWALFIEKWERRGIGNGTNWKMLFQIRQSKA